LHNIAFKIKQLSHKYRLNDRGCLEALIVAHQTGIRLHETDYDQLKVDLENRNASRLITS